MKTFFILLLGIALGILAVFLFKVVSLPVLIFICLCILAAVFLYKFILAALLGILIFCALLIAGIFLLA